MTLGNIINATANDFDEKQSGIIGTIRTQLKLMTNPDRNFTVYDLASLGNKIKASQNLDLIGRYDMIDSTYKSGLFQDQSEIKYQLRYLSQSLM